MTVNEPVNHNVNNLRWFDYYLRLIYSQVAHEEYSKDYFLYLI